MPSEGPHGSHISACPHASPRRVLLKVATYNVTSLDPRDEDRAHARLVGVILASRVQLLEIDCFEHGFDIVGIQESRCRANRVRKGLYYDMYESAADASGCFGTQLWVARRLRLSVQSWAAISHRTVFVHGTFGDRAAVLRCIVAHAPHEHRAACDKDAFWDELHHATATRLLGHSADLPMLLIDANARVGSVDSSAVGPCEPEHENDNGSRLHGYLAQNRLAAVNTFFDAGKTWHSSRRTTSRIDYIVMRESALPSVEQATTVHDMASKRGTHDDHVPVAASIELDVVEPSAEHAAKVANPRVAFNKHRVRDPQRRAAFQRAMDRYAPPDADVDVHLEHLNEYVNKAARSSFGAPAECPTKPWISPLTWSYVRRNAMLRRLLARVWSAKGIIGLKRTFAAWRYAVPAPFVPGANVPLFGWGAQQAYHNATDALYVLFWCEAMLYHGMNKYQRACDELTSIDRLEHLTALAMRAQTAAHRGDCKTTYAIVRSLGGRHRVIDKSIRLEDGTLAPDEHSRQLRWQQHSCEVFNGAVVPYQELLRRAGNRHRSCAIVSDSELAALRCAALDTELSFAALPANKGVGTDSIPGELLRAGGAPIARAYHGVEARIVRERRWPVRWCGGRIAECRKRGNPSDLTDSYRGLLLADHVSKSFVGRLKIFVDPLYNAHMPAMQCGAVPGRGTDFAHHLTVLTIDYAAANNMSSFILFIGQIKAFDRVVREVVMGWNSDAGDDHVAYLMSLGLARDSAEFLANLIDEHGSLFEQWGVDNTVRDLVAQLHCDAWFAYGALDSIILTAKGGRQGCKLGSTIYNSCYSLALHVLHLELRSIGALLRLLLPERSGGHLTSPTPTSSTSSTRCSWTTLRSSSCRGPRVSSTLPSAASCSSSSRSTMCSPSASTRVRKRPSASSSTAVSTLAHATPCAALVASCSSASKASPTSSWGRSTNTGTWARSPSPTATSAPTRSSRRATRCSPTSPSPSASSATRTSTRASSSFSSTPWSRAASSSMRTWSPPLRSTSRC